MPDLQPAALFDLDPALTLVFVTRCGRCGALLDVVPEVTTAQAAEPGQETFRSAAIWSYLADLAHRPQCSARPESLVNTPSPQP